MADYALWSGATGAGNGSSWADAYTSIQSLVSAIGSVPTRVFVASDHSEQIATTLTFPAAAANGYTLISCDRTSGYPPTVEQAGAVISSTNATNLAIQNDFVSKGVFWKAGANSTATRNLTIESSSGAAHFTRIIGGGIELQNTGSGSRIILGTGATSRTQRVELRDAEIRFGHTGQGFQIQNATLDVRGGSVAGSAITELFKAFSLSFCNVFLSGVNLSAAAASFNFLASSLTVSGRFIADRCRMPASWTGGIASTTPVMSALEATLTNCDNADTQYRLTTAQYDSIIRQETTVVRTGGGVDGSQAVSWKVTTGSMNYPVTFAEVPMVHVRRDTVGSSVTVTAHVLTDGVTLNDDEAWLEVIYMGTSGHPLGVTASDEKSNLLAAGSAQDASTETWVTTGLTSPVKQKLSVTITPQEVGWITARVRVARSSTTVYVCPKIEVA